MRHSGVLFVISVLPLTGTAGAASTLHAATSLGATTLADGDWPIQASIGGTLSPTGVVLSIAH